MAKVGRWIGAVSLLGALACGAETEVAEPRHEPTDSAPVVDFSTVTPSSSGLYAMDVEMGSGEEASTGSTVVVHYTGWFLDGEKFDSSVDRGEPFSFTLGAGQVIQGWDQGVAGMRVGGWRRLVIPPDLAYGAAGRPGIPANATLVFDVELMGLEGG